MSSSTSSHRVFAALTPAAALLVSVGTALYVADVDAALWAYLVGIVLLAAGIAGIHGLIARRYGPLGFVGFMATELALLGIFLPLSGLGYLVLIPAAAVLAWALMRMEPPLRGPALALVAVWPAAWLLAQLSPVAFGEALAIVFALPYAWLALDARRLPAEA